MNQLAKSLIGRLFGATLLPFLLRRKLVIFTFHRVLTTQEYANCRFEKSITVTDTGLASFLHHIKQHFDIIPLSQLTVESHNSPSENNKPQAVITFDDGWRDNYTLGLPLFRQYQIPATVFLSTAYIDSPLGFWWQHLGEMLTAANLNENQRQAIKDLILQTLGKPPALLQQEFNDVDALIHIIKRDHYDQAIELTQAIARLTNTELRPHGLSWEECREMSEHGIEFGSHTLNHPRLSLLQGDKLKTELADSKQRIIAQNINYVDAICYPYGDYNQAVVNESQRNYRIGLTTNSGIVAQNQRVSLTLPRINVSEQVARHIGLLNYRLLKAAVKG